MGTRAWGPGEMKGHGDQGMGTREDEGSWGRGEMKNHKVKVNLQGRWINIGYTSWCLLEQLHRKRERASNA